MKKKKKLKEASLQMKKISCHHLSLCNNQTSTNFFINSIIKLLPLKIKEDLKL